MSTGRNSLTAEWCIFKSMVITDKANIFVQCLTSIWNAQPFKKVTISSKNSRRMLWNVLWNKHAGSGIYWNRRERTENSLHSYVNIPEADCMALVKVITARDLSAVTRARSKGDKRKLGCVEWLMVERPECLQTEEWRNQSRMWSYGRAQYA